MKQSHLRVKVSLMNTLWQQMITFGQNHNTHGILVVSIFHGSSQWIEGIRDTPCRQEFFTIYTVFFLFFMDVIQLLIAETNKHYNQ
jgi:hypothetical protein